jgi:hypothetical protein
MRFAQPATSSFLLPTGRSMFPCIASIQYLARRAIANWHCVLSGRINLFLYWSAGQALTFGSNQRTAEERALLIGRYQYGLPTPVGAPGIKAGGMEPIREAPQDDGAEAI